MEINIDSIKTEMSSIPEMRNDDTHYDTTNFYIGLGLAIASSVFIG